MANNSFDSLRLYLMHDLLPVGMAIIDRTRRGKAKTVVDTFASSKEPFSELRDEGEIAAKYFRERLDEISPGLGNPVEPVNVAIENEESMQSEEVPDNESLQKLLKRIDKRLVLLEQYLQDNEENIASSSQENG
tara:strand:- start:242 stop:643 length:402 start_codon:yes stop_codon:yes gene_type:complete